MPRILSRNNRVLGAVAALAIAALAITAGVNRLSDTEQATIDGDSLRLEAIHELVDELGHAAHDQEAALDDYVLSEDAVARTRYEDAVASETASFDALVDRASGLTEIDSAVTALHAASLAWQDTVAEPALAAARSNNLAALDLFAAQAVADHAVVEAAAENLEAVIGRAQQALDARRATVTATRGTATTAGFAVLLVAFGVALLLVRRYGHTLESDSHQAGVLNRFTEVTSFAVDDREIANTNLIALGRLAKPDASVTHVLNRSKDRAVPEAVSGKVTAEVLPLNALGRCAGVVRGTIYVTDDLSDDLSVRCPIYPAKSGTLACVPLNSGESVGAVHLYWARPNAFPLEVRANVARVAEHAALAIGNRRLLAALHGQANTDPRTGLANSRAFDIALETALTTRTAEESLAVLMVDIDHFKAFNDRHGHPAGDEALRAFARVLAACMREGDVAARYGGEEFAVLLDGVDAATAIGIAERVRGQIESTIISLAPGLTDRITVSVGVAVAPEQGLERVGLLRVADEALYQAKDAGRNRVTYLGAAPSAASRPRSATARRSLRKSA